MNKSAFFKKSVAILMTVMVNAGFVSSNLEVFASKKMNETSSNKKEAIDVDELDSKNVDEKVSRIKELEKEINALKEDMKEIKTKRKDKDEYTKESLVKDIKALGNILPKTRFNRAVRFLMEKYKMSKEDIVCTFFKDGGAPTVDNTCSFKTIWTNIEYFYNNDFSTKFMDYLWKNYSPILIFKDKYAAFRACRCVVDMYFSVDIFLSKDKIVEAFSLFVEKEKIGEGNVLI